MAQRTIALLIAFVLIVPLVACGGGSQPAFSTINSGLGNGSGPAHAPTSAPTAAAAAREAATAPALAAASTASAGGVVATAPLADAAPPAGAEGSAAGSAPVPARTATATNAEAPATSATAPQRPAAPEASLKAGERDDNVTFTDYLAYLKGYQATDVRPADVSERYLIRVIDDNQRPVLDARVTVYDGERTVFQGRTYAGGKTIFMPRRFDTGNSSSFRVVAEYGQARAETTFQRGATEQVELGLRNTTIDQTLRLDLLFLLDTTGSMDDELSRIQQTIDSIAARIDAFTPRPQIRYGLVAYRDTGDAYVTRPTDFTPDLAAFRAQLSALNADGGGDTPEALDEALNAGIVQAAWSDTPAVRLAFLVGDAGPHVLSTTQFTYLDATREAVARGIKIYPIAASNTDPQAEYVFRQLAQQTLGGFVFLTYQEGASGGAPGESTTLEAGTQAYTVERLDDLIVGIVKRELAAAVGVR